MYCTVVDSGGRAWSTPVVGSLCSSSMSVRSVRICLSLAVDSNRCTCRADAPKQRRIRLEAVLEGSWNEPRVLGLPGR